MPAPRPGVEGLAAQVGENCAAGVTDLEVVARGLVGGEGSFEQLRCHPRLHDDPRHPERPADFGKEAALSCYTRLVGALEERFGPHDRYFEYM
jgi:hypothetical protein